MLDAEPTEGRLAGARELDRLSTLELVRLMNAENARVADAVGTQAGPIAAAVDAIAARMLRGGRLLYVGAGTSGRLGVLDASECPPTFGVPPGLVVGVIAGGPDALVRAVEGAEDDAAAGAAALAERDVDEADCVVGVATSGRTPFVLGAVRVARERGALTVALACNPGTELERTAELAIVPVVGPEVLSGSTRMKAGTATKLVLNALSTGAMVRLGKTYGDLMVDLVASNEKLRLRARRLVRALTELDERAADEALAAAGGELKTAVVAVRLGLDPPTARTLLDAHGGHLRAALESG